MEKSFSGRQEMDGGRKETEGDVINQKNTELAHRSSAEAPKIPSNGNQMKWNENQWMINYLVRLD